VPKVQHKPIKVQERVQIKRAKDNPKAALVWLTGLSGVPPDCPVRQRSNGYTAPTVVCNDTVKVNSARLRAQKSEQRQKAHRTVNSDCPVAHLSEAPTVRTQRPGDVAGAPDSVRWRTGAPCDRSPHQWFFWWLGL
jgi:hypothetical protein